MEKNKIKIGIINIQSGIATTKGYFQYLFHFHKYFTPHNSQNIIKLAKLCDKHDVDVLASVEMDQGSRRTRHVDQPELLSKNTNFKYYNFFLAFQVDDIIKQGNAIHSKYEIVKSESFKLPGSGEQRVLGKSKINIGNQLVSVFVTHLSLQGAHRKKQIEIIAEEINRTNTPVILAGDFNIAHQGELDLLEKSKLQKVFSAKTYPSWKPKKNLDFIFASKNVMIFEGEVLPDKISDHNLLTVEMIL